MTEFASHHTEAKSAGWCSVKTHCYPCGQRQVQERCGGCIPPPAIFKHVDEYSFSTISNLFDNNKPYALSTYRIIKNVQTKCIIFGETLRFKGKQNSKFANLALKTLIKKQRFDSINYLPSIRVQKSNKDESAL